ncbi:MAG: ABC transporter ATP-binding protein [Saprospiraceae bacterium]|nr:ABC transporter ATP-binding protein [Saprospiraceae bacterium]
MEPIPVLEFDSVCFSYPHEKNRILDESSFRLYQGERAGIIGDNGCGKSTILKLMLAIYKPQKGKINLFGKPVSWSNYYSNIGYVGDPGYNTEQLGLPDDIKVNEALYLMAKLYDRCGKPHKIFDYEKKLGLTELGKRNIGNLSTGERKRLMMCLALSKYPSLVILDEPIDGLDANIKPNAEQVIKEVIEDQSTTILYISHNRMDLDEVTHKLYRLYQGKLSLESQPQFEVTVSDEQNKKLYDRRKTGQVQKILHGLLDSEVSDFQIHIKRV